MTNQKPKPKPKAKAKRYVANVGLTFPNARFEVGDKIPTKLVDSNGWLLKSGKVQEG